MTTTDDVRFNFAMHVSLQPVRMGISERGNKLGPALEEFDRWLAEYTRQQREEAWAQGYADGQDSVYTAVDGWPNPDIKNPYRTES